MRSAALTRCRTLGTRRTPRFLLVLLALALSGGCGGDSAAPSAPTPATPAPTPPPAPAPTPEPAPTCQVGMVLRPGESCTYPGTSNALTINPDGTASFLFVTSGSAINVTSGNVSLQATRQSDGSWRVERVGASSGGEGAATFREGERIPDFPTGVPNTVSGGSFSLSGGVVTITLRRDGYVEYPEHRYTCDASQCGIRGGLVTAGVIVRTATGGGGTPNRAPRAVGNISDQTLTEDGSATTVNVSARFSDPDGDNLRYRATSSRTSVVRTSVSGSRVTLTPRDAGTATVTVTATDPGGLSATQRFTVTVTATGGGEGMATFREGDRIPNFPTGVPNVTSGGSFSLSGGVVTITLRRDGYVEYPEHRYTCDASQCGIRGGLVTAGVIVRTATGGGGTPNRAPRAVGNISDQTLTEDGSATTVNVSARFSDPDGDNLRYRATSSRTSVVRTSVSGSRVTLTPRDAGTATVTVTATDPGGLSATQRFTVTVTATGGGEGMATFREGDRIPNFPTGVPNVTSGGSFSLSGGVVTITLRRDGYVEYPEHRYTCDASQCGIRGGLVTAGVIVRTASGDSGSSTGSPTGSTGDDCSIEDLGTLRGTTPQTRSGSLGRDCESPNESGKLARYYSFRLSDASEVQIDLESSAFDPLLVLRQGSSISGRQIERDDDGGTGNNAQIARELSAGVYTIEATSFRRDTTGAFTIRVARTGGGGTPTVTGKAVEFVGDLDCSVTESVPNSGLLNGTVSGRLRATRAVSFVTVTGVITERTGARRDHSLSPHLVGSMEAGETEPFATFGIFTSSATRFGCSATVEWTEIRQAGRDSLRKVAPTSILKSPPN